MRSERRFRAVGARTLRDPGELEQATDRDMPGDGRPTTSGHATARRFAAPHPHGPGRAPPGPRDRRNYAEKQPPAPNRSPGPPAKKPAILRQVPHARQRPARRPSSSPGTPPPLRYSPARQHPPPQAPGRQTTRRRQAGPSTGRRRPQVSCIRTTASRTRPPQPATGSPPDGIAGAGPGLHYTNWSRPMSRLV
jgi:hypothetical protein